MNDEANQYATLLECAINVAVNISEEFDISELWEQFEPTLDKYLANLRECSSIENAEAIQK